MRAHAQPRGQWEAVTALASSLVSASSSEGRDIDHEPPLPVCHWPGRHGRAGKELKIIAITWQTNNWPQDAGVSGVVGLWKIFWFCTSPSLPPCFCTAGFQPPGDRLLKEARPASICCPSSIRLSGERSTECSPRQDDGRLLSRPGETCSFSDGDESQMILSPRIRAFPGPLERARGSLIP